METRKRNTKKRSLVTIFCLLAPLIYLALQTLSGNLGMVSYFRLKSKLNQAQTRLKEKDIEKASLASKVDLLKPESIDYDMIEEKLKAKLSMSSSEELMFIPNKTQEKQE